MKTKNAYIANMIGIYCRISQEKVEGKDRSIDYQKEVGVALAMKLGLEYKVYVDEGISGTWDIDKRPALNQMMDDIGEGLITSVFVLEQSRLERNVQVRFVINQTFLDNDVRLYTESGEVDLNNDEMTFMGDIMSLMNSFAVKVTKRKVKAVLKKNAREGKAHGILPYGYTTDEHNKIIVCPTRSKIVKLIYNLSLEGVGFKTIANKLNDKGVPTYYKTKWSAGSVRGIIKNSTYTGVRKFGDESFNIPVIISPRIWKKVNEHLVANMSGGHKQNEYKYILNGITTCGKCGRPFNGRYIKNQNHSYYQCVTKRFGKNSCGNLAVRAEELKRILYDVYFGDVGRLIKIHNKFYSTDILKNRVDELTNKIIQAQNSLTNNANKKSKLIQTVMEGLFTRTEIRSELDKIEQEKDELAEVVSRCKDKLLEIKAVMYTNVNITNDITNINSIEAMGKRIHKYIKRVDVSNNGKKIKLEVEFVNPSYKLDVINMKASYPLVIPSSLVGDI